MSKILIIEDEVAIAELQRDYLEMNGFEVEVCGDGAVGAKEAIEHEYDLIILDCQRCMYRIFLRLCLKVLFGLYHKFYNSSYCHITLQ